MDDPRAFLPLTPQQFHILLALTGAHLHGYAIIGDVEQRTAGALRLGTGTLYTALARLEALALVDESNRRAPAGEDNDLALAGVAEFADADRLTPLGRAVLTAETERLESLVRHARAKGIAGAGRPAFSRSR